MKITLRISLRIAAELGFRHDQYVEVRLKYSDKRTVFRRSP